MQTLATVDVQQQGGDRWHHQRPGETDKQHQHGDGDRRSGRGRGGQQSQAGGHQDESGDDDVSGAETLGDPRR